MNHTKLQQERPILRTLHNRIPGRVRYKVIGLQQSKNLQQYLEFRLSREPGINSVRVSSWTGNILILFTKELGFNGITSLVTIIIQEYRQKPKQAIQLMEKWSQPAA